MISWLLNNKVVIDEMVFTPHSTSKHDKYFISDNSYASCDTYCLSIVTLVSTNLLSIMMKKVINTVAGKIK